MTKIITEKLYNYIVSADKGKTIPAYSSLPEIDLEKVESICRKVYEYFPCEDCSRGCVRDLSEEVLKQIKEIKE